MFGFVVPDPEKLDARYNEHYRAVYCGLCDSIGKQYSFINRLSLTFDFTFLIIVLSAVTGETYTFKTEKCPVRIKKQNMLINRYTMYAADMNILLAYYKLKDDINDDSSPTAVLKSALFSKAASKIIMKYPKKNIIIADNLNNIAQAETDNILLPDVPADYFGNIMAELFSCPENGDKNDLLREFGKKLGRAIYVMDAAVDLKKDLKHKKYNPLITASPGAVELMINDALAGVMESYRKLQVKTDKEIIENILLSGIWTSYISKQKKGKKSGDKRSL